MTKILIDRAVVEQALHVATAAGYPVALIAALKAALAEPTLQTCNCRWDGEVQVQQCTLHEAHVDAIHEWAGRAKTAEKKLAALAEPVPPIGKASTDVGVPVYVVKKAEPCNKSCAPGYCYCEPVEPVAWMVYTEDGKSVCVTDHPADFVQWRSLPLYTAPPQRKPLTREEAIALWADKSDGPSNAEIVSYCRAIERAHGIKEAR